MKEKLKNVYNKEPSVVTHICNHIILKVEVRASAVQGYVQLHSEFETTLGYLRLCFKNKKRRTVERLGRGTEKRRGGGEERVRKRWQCRKNNGLQNTI